MPEPKGTAAVALTIHLKSQKAKSELADDMAKAEAKAARKKARLVPIPDKATLRGFWVQYPKACALFGKIMVQWRGSYSTRPGHHGYWAAYPYAEWSQLSGLPVATLKRQLDLLEQKGLIERELGKHSGSRVLSFIRPTKLALDLSDCRPGDYDHLTAGKSKAKPEPAPLPYVLKPVAPVQEAKPETLEELLAIIGKPEKPTPAKPPE